MRYRRKINDSFNNSSSYRLFHQNTTIFTKNSEFLFKNASFLGNTMVYMRIRSFRRKDDGFLILGRFFLKEGDFLHL